MATVTPKLEIVVNINQPVEEIKACIAAIVNHHPGRQLEILQQVDLWLGETIISIEKEVKVADGTSLQEKNSS